MKVRSTSGDSLRITTRELGPFLAPPARLERPLGVEPAAGMMVGEATTRVGGRCWSRRVVGRD